jgi:NADH-quinone oxidoreductase subunit N
MSNLLLFLPETLCLLAALAIFAAIAFDASYAKTWIVAVVGAAAMTIGAGATLMQSGDPFAAGMYHVDLFSQVVKLVVAGGTLMVLLISRHLEGAKISKRAEVVLFLFLSSAGLMLLVSSTELLTLYVSLELAAYSLYVAVALHRDALSTTEAATKYIVQGAVASAIALFGISILFGVTGTTRLAGIVEQAAGVSSQPAFLLGLLMLFGGFFFKLAAFPFHFWIPDVYQAAPNQVVAYLASVPKVVAVALLCRISAMVVGHTGDLVTVFMIASIVAMTIGNLAAIMQKDIKRLLAYSAIAHAGYALVGLLAFSQQGLTSALFYGVIYGLMAFATLVVVCLVSADGTNPTLESLSGLYKRSPLLAVALLVGIFGLGGIPPTVGFAGKWFLFAAAIERGHTGLVLIAAINSTIALYYYLRIIKHAYLDPPLTEQPIVLTASARATTMVALALVVGLGILPGPLWQVVARATELVMGMP